MMDSFGDSRIMTIRRGEECPVREKIICSDNRVGIRKFKRRERRELIVERIGKLEIDVRDRLWTWI